MFEEAICSAGKGMIALAWVIIGGVLGILCMLPALWLKYREQKGERR